MNETKKIKIGISQFPPMVLRDGKKYSGFEIELWEKIANHLQLNEDSYSYTELPFEEIIPKLSVSEVDVAIAGITETEQREHVADFSHETFSSGLHIMVLVKKRISYLASAYKAIFSKSMIRTLLFVTAFVIIAGHALWITEKGASLSLAYMPGIFESFWWTIVTISTVGYGDISPVTWVGRIVASLVIFSGLAVFGLFIANISSSLTLAKLKGDISKPEDLKNIRVATKKETVVVPQLRSYGAKVVTSDTVDDAITLLKEREVDAVVFDAPVLLYIDSKDNDVMITGEMFNTQSYGFAFPDKSSLREDVNRALLHIRESGEYDELYKKWFAV